MQFLLTRNWHCGSAGGTQIDLTVPAGAQIDGTNPLWRGTPLPTPLPISAQPLDEAALDAMKAWYPGPEQQRWFVIKGF
jgi:hypothetical protein